MADEILPNSRGAVLVKAESTYGTDPTPGVTNFVYFDEFTCKINANIVPRNGMAPFGPGWRSYPGHAGTGEFSGSLPITSLTLSASPTELPPEDVVLQMIGFSAGVLTTVGDSLCTYTYLHQNQLSGTIWKYDYNELAAGANIHNLTKMTGCRAAGSISHSGDGAGVLSFTGESQDITTESATATPGTVTAHTDCPLAGGVGTAVITEIGASTVYGGLVYDCEFTFYPLTVSSGLTERIVRLDAAPGPVAVKFTMEQQTQGDWDPDQYVADKTTCTVVITVGSTATGQNNVYYTFSMQLTDVNPIPGPSGAKVWEIEGHVVYPDASSDGGGRTPVASTFTMTYRTED